MVTGNPMIRSVRASHGRIVALIVLALLPSACWGSRLATSAQNPDEVSPTSSHTASVAAGPLIAFTRSGDIWVMRPNGAHLTRLTTYSQQDQEPTWSPDGSRIAFVRDADPRDAVVVGGDTVQAANVHFDIFVMDRDGTDLRRLTNDPAQEEWLDWSPDGSKVAYTLDTGGQQQIWIVDVATGAKKELGGTNGTNYSPSWSPDGSRIVFDADYLGHHAIYEMNADGGGVHRLMSGPHDLVSPALSPNGHYLALGVQYHGQFDLSLATASGKVVRRLTNTRTLSEENPSWAPNGRAIVYQAAAHIYRVTLRSGVVQQLTRGEGFAYAPSWGKSAGRT